jgi:ribosome biogenesis GTPase
MDQLDQYGWNDELAKAWAELAAPDCVPARVIADYAANLKIALPQERRAEISGKLAHALDDHQRPKVGDWVAVRIVDASSAVVEHVLPRHSEISRRAVGDRVRKQVMAANVDVAFIVQALDHDFSPSRLQRYLYQLQNSHIEPVVVLNKSDKVDDAQTYIDQITPLGIHYVLTSATTGDGVQGLLEYFLPGKTAVLLGSSGVGKSTLTNLLLGEAVQKTQAIRQSDSKGRHTTSHRELFAIKNGGLLIDTPGIRELQLWGTQEELEATFADITQIALDCRFSTCGHTTEPDCAIRAAIADGSLAQARFDNYTKMKAELDTAAKRL